MMSRKRRQFRQAVRTFGTLNIVLAAICLMGVLFFLGWPFFVVPARTGWGYMGAVAWSIIFGLTGFLFAIVYCVAGLGLLRRWKIGYYAHLFGALFAAFSCIGVGYTIYAFIYTFTDDFTDYFFAECQ
jgi:hypothetical protein